MLRLSTFVISLVVVGTALVVATRVALKAEPKPDKPATPVAQRVRGDHRGAESDRGRETADGAGSSTAWHRMRSAILLVALLTALGALAALVVVIVGAIVLTGLRSAVQ